MAAMFRNLVADLRQMRRYFAVSCCLFVAGFAAGGMDPGLDVYLNQSVESLRDVAQQLGSSNHPQMYFFVFIFLNNAIKSIAFVYLGVFLAILPLIALVTNGMVLGFVMLHPAQELPFMTLLVKGILPHGIIELPAIIVACAYGIRIGVLALRWLASLAIPRERRSEAGAQLVRVLRLTLPLSGVLTVALLVAAVIESTITYALMN